MALARVYSRALKNLDAPLVTVEADIANGMPAFSIVGLASTLVKESKDRVRSALLNSQFEFPAKRITINLAPANIPKESSGFDLAIALGILAASGQITTDRLNLYEFSGELALSGELRGSTGILPFAMATAKADRTLIIPPEYSDEAIIIKDIKLLTAKHLLEVCAYFNDEKNLITPTITINTNNEISKNISEVVGQAHAKRALEIAAAGCHSMLMTGPPGSGKTMLAQRLAGIMPNLNEKQALESASIKSISGQKINIDNWKQRPFRSPHHSASAPALVGGGNPPRPGEISLAHNGVLFLDELPEFNRNVLETLREPLESGIINISRAGNQAQFPASFQLIAAMNPCPCGYLGHQQKNCRCTSEQVMRYNGRISGPFLDRIDLYLQVPYIQSSLLASMKNQSTETSETIKIRVQKAFDIQINRQGCSNNLLAGELLNQHCKLDDVTKQFIIRVIEKWHLSTRAYHRVIKLARTIADLAESKEIDIQHLSEALNYRQFNVVNKNISYS